MRMTSLPAFVLVAVIGLAAPALVQESRWEVRLGQLGDQKDEWTDAGYVPGWDVKIGPGEAPTIEISGDDKTGDYRGIVMVGRRWRVPDPAPPWLRAELQYQTYCACDDPDFLRAGQASLAVYTVERWEQLATDPAQAEMLDARRTGDGVVGVWTIHSSQEDVTEWRDWQSGNMVHRLREHAGEEVVLALVWSAAHYGTEERAGFRGLRMETMGQDDLDRQVFDALDLARPDLQAVKAALDQDDLPGAKAALAAHFRTRERPVGPPLSPDGSERGIALADRICEHVFSFVGCPPTTIEGPIQWNEDPHNYDQWAIALNRHSHWVSLGRAYAATSDEKYAQEFVAQLNGWVAAMPVHIGRHWVQGPFFESGKSPLTLDAGIRMAQTWWPAYYYFKDSPHFDAKSQFAMVRSLHDHALYLMEPRYFRVESNWGQWRRTGCSIWPSCCPSFARPISG